MRLFGKKIPNFGFRKLDFLVFRVRKKRFWSLMGVPSSIFGTVNLKKNRHCETFSKIFNVSKGFPSFFQYFAAEWMSVRHFIPNF